MMLPARLQWALRRSVAVWLDPSSVRRRDATSALMISTGFPSEEVDRALSAVFEPLSEAALEELFARARRESRSAKRVLHVAAGNVFTAWLHGVIISLALGHETWIKPSMADTVFPLQWRQSLLQEDSSFESLIRVTPWREGLFDEVNAIVAYGSDYTLTQLERQAEGKSFIRYGHKASIAVICASALDDKKWLGWKNKLRSDVIAFDLAGCLSPQIVYVQGAPDRVRSVLPQGRLPDVQSFSAREELDGVVQRLGPSLSCIGLAGSAEDERFFAGRYDAAIRVCPLGEMQRPPLSWHNGGIDLVKELSTI